MPIQAAARGLANGLLQRVIGTDKEHQAEKIKRLINRLNTKNPSFISSGNDYFSNS
jgi:hypothetical protein